MFTFVSFLIFLIFVLWKPCAFCLQLPSDIHTCTLSDLKFEECLRTSMEGALPILAGGNDEFGISPIEPLTIQDIILPATSGPISLAQKYTNIRLIGLSKLKILKISLDLNKCTMHIEALFPSTQTNCNYDYKGQLLLFPIDAYGPLVINLKNVGATCDVTCEKFTDDNVEYIRIINSSVNAIPESVEFQLGTLISGNEELDEQVKKVLMDDPRALFEVVRPTTNLVFSNLFKEVANKIFTKVPLQDIFQN